MPKPRKIALETPTARAKLPPRKASYFVRVAPNVALGYRRNQSGFGTWSVRFADGSPNGWLRKFGTADDLEPANNKSVFNYDQAIKQARTLARGDADTETDTASGFAPISVDGALTAYERDLETRQSSIYNARMPRKHLTPALLMKPVSMLSANELKRWRDGLIGGELVDASINRMLKCLRAALNLAARLDKRIQNKDAWTDGLESLSDADNARNVILTDKQVTAFVRASYAHDAALGLYVDVLAESGARASQASRLLVSDLIAHPKAPRVSMPKAGKGGAKNRTKQKAERYSVAISERLANRLKVAAVGRADDAPLLVQADGTSWGERPNDNYGDGISAVVANLKFGSEVTMGALRHSSIVRALLKGIPVRVVAASHNSSTVQIERTYSKHILDHADDLQRRALLDHDEPADNVVALAS
ncbi:site-specific integrase [Bradyrhizobium sp. CSS354]|uniref:site-specific integrase n=1 Tax=Bradyrhizobium sp. CSS354 TaxID=2699172 RepID=UPI0023AF912F|nr:site-specific integrase [Bradyrhizobium sp. CSS354]MDE5461148.1 site-specific integrase [Bradyrhizobium sp. CSS354]